MGNYRVRYKKGDFEIEVESTEQAFVEKKLKELVSPAAGGASSSVPTKTAARKASSASSNGDGDATDTLDLTTIVNMIKESSDYDNIETHILKKSTQVAKVLLCLYFADAPLTTNDIESITGDLGSRILARNASGTLHNNGKYVAVHKQGAIVRYKINLKGKGAYEKIIKGEKPS